MSIWNRKKRHSPSSRDVLKERVQEAKGKTTKSIEFEYDEITDVVDLTLEELRRTSQESIEKVKEATDHLRKLGTIRAPAPGPTETVKTG